MRLLIAWGLIIQGGQSIDLAPVKVAATITLVVISMHVRRREPGPTWVSPLLCCDGNGSADHGYRRAPEPALLEFSGGDFSRRGRILC
jgi:hypothetical protein